MSNQDPSHLSHKIVPLEKVFDIIFAPIAFSLCICYIIGIFLFLSMMFIKTENKSPDNQVNISNYANDGNKESTLDNQQKLPANNTKNSVISTQPNSSDSHSTCLGAFNTCYISFTGFALIGFFNVVAFILLFMLLYLNQLPALYRFGGMIFISLIMLFSLVFVTGGVLDSPFSGAIGIYVGSYFIVQERKDLKLVNWFVLFVILAAILLPYYIVWCNEQIYILNWNSNQPAFFTRLILTLGLMFFAGYMGNTVNKKLEAEQKS